MGWDGLTDCVCLCLHEFPPHQQVPIELVSKDKFEGWLQAQDPRTQALMAFKVRPRLTAVVT